MNLDQLIIEADPEFDRPAPTHDGAEGRVVLTRVLSNPTNLPGRHRRPTRRATILGVGVGALIVVLSLGLILNSSGPTSSNVASAAPFLRRAAHVILTRDTFTNPSAVVPQPDQYVYSETEDPNGTLQQIWLSVDGENAGLNHWVSGIKGEVPASGTHSLPPCTLSQAGAEVCGADLGYYPNMPTDPTELLAYLNQYEVVDTDNPPSDAAATNWDANDLGNALDGLLTMSYVTPVEQAAVFNLLAQTPGFYLIPSITDVIGRKGVGVAWNFEGSANAMIFNPTTYALLGTRTWPGPVDFSAPYDGDAVLGTSVVNSLPANLG